MSEERIVNRVSQTPAYVAEGKKLTEEQVDKIYDGRLPVDAIRDVSPIVAELMETPTVDEQPVYDALTGKIIDRDKFNQINEQTAIDLGSIKPKGLTEGQLVKVGPAPVIESDPDLEVSEPRQLPPDTHYSASAELISQLLKQRTSGNSDLFKQQVILAFRHLGLDTKKFFPD